LQYCYGQDYGFSIDPTTLIKVAVNKKKKLIYAKEIIYTKERLGTDEICQINKSNIDKPNDLIVADSAEVRLISELRAKGLNIIGAKKGAGSIRAGITKINDYTIIVDNDSHNLKYELNNYIFSDKKSKIAIDKNNHLIDAMRYALEKLLIGNVSIV